MKVIISFLLGGFIFINSVFDLKEKRVPIVPCYFLIPLGIVINIMFQLQSIPNLIFSFIPGFILMIVAKLTNEEIGYGDAWIVMCIGAYFPLIHVITILFGAFILAGLCGLIMMIRFHKHKKLTIPFIPFLFLAYLLERILL